MNARIKELYDQAHLVREYPADDPMRGGSPATVYWGGETSAEKFAELIVRECIQVGGPEDSYTDEWFKAKADSVARIKKHFGVEK